jgi:hypothetical protein
VRRRRQKRRRRVKRRGRRRKRGLSRVERMMVERMTTLVAHSILPAAACEPAPVEPKKGEK